MKTQRPLTVPHKVTLASVGYLKNIATKAAMALLPLLAVTLLAGAILTPASAATFQAGDQWCAIGDSITHGGSYHRYIYLFQATRFPNAPVDFFNCGISGDTASGALRRFNADILAHKPTVATIMLGMNDVSRNLYDEGLSAPDLQERRDKAITAHCANMRTLAEKLQAAGTRMIFLTPSIFDETAMIPRPNSPGVNGALAKCAESAKQLAHEFHGSLVDFHGPMTELNRKEQLANPAATIIGADRIHPGELGHFIMAYLFLKSQGAPQFVSDITVDAAGKDTLSFTQKEDALPFPVSKDCAPALKLVSFMEDLNQERLRVTNLPEGSYKLNIDNEPISTFTASELASGINLAVFENTPQCKQAQAVAKLDDKRLTLLRRLRGIDYIEWKMGRDIGDLTEFDFAAGAQKIIEDPKHIGYVRDRAKEYIGIKPEQATLQKQLQEIVAEIRTASQPKPHLFSIGK